MGHVQILLIKNLTGGGLLVRETTNYTLLCMVNRKMGELNCPVLLKKEKLRQRCFMEIKQ